MVEDTPGPYFEKVVFPSSGNAIDGSITLQAAPGHAPVLDGNGVSGEHMVLIDSKSYVRLIGFEIRNNLKARDGSGVRVTGSGSFIEIRDNDIHDIRGRDAMGITVYGTEPTPISNLVIDGNVIHDCEPFRSEALTLNGNVADFEVTNNVVHDVNNIGIDCIGGETDIQPNPTLVCRNGVIRGNQVHRANEKNGGFAGGIYVDGGRDLVIENNVVSESDLGIEIGAENAGLITENVVVRNNVLFRNAKACIVFGGFAAAVGRVESSQFLNNTCYRNDTAAAGFGELWVQFAESNTVRNNLFYGTGRSPLLANFEGSVGNDLDYNLWFVESGGLVEFVWEGTSYAGFGAFQAGAAQDVNGQFASPQLVDPEAEDFHLAAASPAIDAGDPGFVTAGAVDLDGSTRVSGGRVDAGADEVTCGDGIQDAGEACDDGDLVDGDGCDSNCTITGCGNAVVTAGEQCDDGNQASGDCCSATCQGEPPAACDDGDACTSGDFCDGGGLCQGTAQAAPSCRQPGRSVVILRDRDDDARNTLTWRWLRGEATSLAAFGAPLDDTDYTLCLYDASAQPQPRLRARVPGGQTCAGRECWKATGTRGYRYLDRYRTPDGLLRLRLRDGGAGEPRIVARGRGADLPLPELGLTTAVEVQLVNADGECWRATFTDAQQNDAGVFRARTD